MNGDHKAIGIVLILMVGAATLYAVFGDKFIP